MRAPAPQARFRAYLFDVQGTLLDFFTPVSTAVAGYLRDNALADVDAAEFTRSWRESYYRRVAGAPPGARVQGEYETGFLETCARHGLPEPDHVAAQAVSLSWQHLVPWPDVRAGMQRLRSKAITVTLSNADTSTLIPLFKDLGIDMDAIFTAEMFGAFKPDPKVYRGALGYLGVDPEESAMVACHPYDLEAAGALGLGTIFVSRPQEYGDPALAHRMAAESVTQRVDSIGEIE